MKSKVLERAVAVLSVPLVAGITVLGSLFINGCTPPQQRTQIPVVRPREQPTTTTTPEPLKVMIVGDSMTFLSSPWIIKDLEGTRLVINAQPGRKIETDAEAMSGLSALDSMLADGEMPDVMVVALGTNDLGGEYPTVEAHEDLIAKVLERVPADVRLVWVNVCFPARGAQATLFNIALDEQLSDRPNSVIADWYEAACLNDPTLLTADRVHPTPAGAQLFSRLILGALP